MAAQVEVQSGEVGRTMTGGRLHLSPLTDSSPSLTESHNITSEAKKPVPAPKPRLTPKPFAVEKTTIKPILAPKPQTTPKLESTNTTGYKPELPNNPKPQQPVAIVKPTPVSTNSSRPATTSFRTAAKVNTGQTVKPTVHPFKPAPPLDAIDTNKSTLPFPAERQKPKNQKTPIQGGVSIARAKSLGFLNQIDKEDEENKSVTVVPPRPQPRGSRPRPVSAVFVTDPEIPGPVPRLVGGNPLSSDLTSKFESIGLSLHRKTVKSNVKESVKPLQQNTQQEKHSNNILRVKPSSADEHSDGIVENISLKETKEDQRGGSIKSRINLLLDSSSMLEVVSSEQKTDILSPEQTMIENEPQVDVKQLIKQLTVETTSTQSPVFKPLLKPRQLHSDLTKKFSSETSSDFVKASLLETSTDHQITQDPQSRIEAADHSGKMAVDFQDQLQQGSSHLEEAEPVSSTTTNQSGVELETVLVSLLPDNNVERSNMNNSPEYLSSPSFRGRRKEDAGPLLTSTYKDPVSPSPKRVNHAVDTFQTLGGRRSLSESIPLPQREDKAMTLRSRRSEGNKPMMETTDLIKGETTPAMAMEQQPRYLRIGSLQKWPLIGIPQDVDVDNGAQMPSQRGKEMDLIKDKDRQREADHEEIAGAPKRMKTLQTDEKSKHKATYFALTGQIQESVSSSDTGCDVIYPVVSYDDIDSGQVNAQGKVAAVKRNLSLNETSGKKSLELKEEVRRTSHISARHVVSALVEPAAEKMTEVVKGEQRTDDERQNAKLKIINEDQRRQMEIEKQAMLQFAQMKEREMQREFERRKAFEREKQKLKEIQNPNQQEIVFEGQEDTEKQAQEKTNRQERAIQIQEVEKQKDLARQRALEKQRRQEMHKQREREMEIQQNLQRQREQELERQQELMRKREVEMENQLQQMRMREQERERLQELERQQELMRFREMEMVRLQEEMRLKEQEREELRRLSEKESQWQKELERQSEMERQQEIERHRELARVAEQVEKRQREVGRRQDQMRPREQPTERPREPEHGMQELERQQEHLRPREREIERQEVERQQMKLMQQEQARLKDQEIQRRREIELQKEQARLKEEEIQRRREIELQKEQENARRREIEMQQEELRQREQEMERQRELMWLREQELERQRELAQQEHLRVKALEMERLRELERQEQKEKQQEYERQQEQMKLREKELERRRELQQQEQLRIRELEKERLRDLERQQRELETERLRELERQQEKARLREQEMERRRELQRQQEEQERVRRQELERLRQRELEMERQRELEREEQHQRQKEQELQRQRELALHQEEMRLKEQERLRGFHQQQEMEQERQRNWERQRQKDEARQTELDKETRLLEMQRNKRIEEQERQSLKEVDKSRERQVHAERKTQRLRHQVSQNERLNWEAEEEKMEKAEADRMRQIARHQEAERLRLKEKQRKDEQEKTAIDQSTLRPKVVDVDSLLRAATSQQVSPSLRWKEPSPRTDERYRSSILDVDSFRSQSQHSSNQDLLSVSGIQEINSPIGTRISRLSPERDITWKVPPQPSANFTSTELDPQSYNKTPHEPRKQTMKMSPEQLPLRLEEHSSAVHSQYRHRQDQVWLPREFKSPDDQEEVWKHRRSQGSKEMNRMRSRSMSRRSAPSGLALEKNLSRIRSRSAHREQNGQNWEQPKQDVNGENDRKESITPVGEIDSQYGTWDTGLRTDDSLTPATPSSESNLSPSPRNATPSHPQSEPDSLDGPPQPPPKPEKQPLLFPDAPTILLDTAVLRSRVQLGKKRAPRTRPSRAARQNSNQAGEGATTSDDWLYRDSTEEKPERNTDQVDPEEQPAAAIFPSQPQRIALFPGVDSQAIKIQLKKMSDSDNPTGLASPSLSSRSPKSPFLPRAARVLPPAGAVENGEEESPQWLKELKSKKRLSQYESES
ncbi:uncharacterized protein LOC144195280 [Stigmatopora nigra]